MMICEGSSLTTWMMYSPRSDSIASMPCFSRKALRCISSETIDLPLTASWTFAERARSSTIWLACSVVSAQCTRMPLLSQLASSFSSSSGRCARVLRRMPPARARVSSSSEASGNMSRRFSINPFIARLKLLRSFGFFKALPLDSRKDFSESLCEE